MAKMLTDNGITTYATTIAKIEAGERVARIDELTGIADLFSVSVDKLLGRRARPKSDLKYTRAALADAVRRAVDVVPDLENTLRERLDDLDAFDFAGRDAITAEVGLAADKLAEAVEALIRAWPHVSGFAVQTEDGKTVVAAPLLRIRARKESDDETQ